MSSNNTGYYEGALLEEMRDEIRAIHESLVPLTPLPAAVAKLQDDMTEVKADVKVIKLAFRDQAKDHRTLVERVAERWNKPPSDDS